MHTFEALILARYQLSTQVLYHPVRRIYDHYLNEYHKALPAEFMNTPRKIFSHDDFSMLLEIRKSADQGPQRSSEVGSEDCGPQSPSIDLWPWRVSGRQSGESQQEGL